MIALACDYRVMNRVRGFLCVNEVDIGLPLTPGIHRIQEFRKNWKNLVPQFQREVLACCVIGMCGIVKSKLDRSLWAPTILGAKRWGGDECLRNRMVDHICDPGNKKRLTSVKQHPARQSPPTTCKKLCP